MVTVTNPLNTRQALRMNKYDHELIIDNPESDSSRNRNLGDLDKSDLLTQNAWNHSPYTRDKNAYRPVTAKPRIRPKSRKYRKILNKDDYHIRPPR